MDAELKKTLKAVTLELRHLLEGRYDSEGKWKPGDLEQRLAAIGVRRDRAAVPVDELGHLPEEDRQARKVVDAYLKLREEASVERPEAVAEFVRETAYTWANRLLALRCMEARELIDPVILQQEAYGGRSLEHHRLAQRHPELCAGDDDGLFAVLDKVFRVQAERLPMLFDPQAPGIALRPSAAALKDCFGLLSLNPDTLRKYRIRLTEDETAGPGAKSPSAFTASDALGWAYQYWNTEEKDRVFEKVRTVKGAKIAGADIVPATQLYTEDYMVKFLVQNSLGATWMGMHPESKLAESWEYYVKDADRAPVAKKPVCEITFLDPACGSGHFHLEAFDLFYAMYQEEGELTTPEEICDAILTKNLFGIDIDPRAVQISEAALWMKAAERAFDYKGEATNLVAATASHLKGEAWEEFLAGFESEPSVARVLRKFAQTMEHIDEIGSLARPAEDLREIIQEEHATWERQVGAKKEANYLFAEMNEDALSGQLPFHEISDEEFGERLFYRAKAGIDAFTERARAAGDFEDQMLGSETRAGFRLLDQLSRRYDVVAANPPYMGSKNMGPALKQYVERHFKPGKRDLYAAFILRNCQLVRPDGRVAMVAQQSWLFLGSYRELRAVGQGNIEERQTAEFCGLIQGTRIEELVHLGRYAFSEIGNAAVAPALFVSRIQSLDTEHRIWACRLTAPRPSAEQCALLSRAICVANLPYVYRPQQQVFLEIPQNPLCYWLRKRLFDLLRGMTLGDVALVVQGLATANDVRFVRFFWEVDSPPCTSNRGRWSRFEKGGGYGKWFGHHYWVLDWHYNGARLKAFPSSVIRNEQHFFRAGWTYSYMASGSFALRAIGADTIVSHLSSGVYFRNGKKGLAALSNCRMSSMVVRSLSAKMQLNESYVERIPISLNIPDSFGELEDLCVRLKRRYCSFDLVERSCDPLGVLLYVKDGVAIALHVIEGFIEHQAFQVFGVSDVDLSPIIDETAMPCGWFGLIAGYDSSPQFARDLSELPDNVSRWLADRERRSLTQVELNALRANACSLYEAGPGAKIEIDEEVTGDMTDDDEQENSNGARIPIPPETFLEELSQKLEIHPISVFELLKEGIEKEGWRCLPEERRLFADRITVLTLWLLGHRWPKQIEAGEPVPDWADLDGIIPLTTMAKEFTLPERVQQRLRADEIDVNDFADVMGKQLDAWLATEFFKHHTKQFKKRPIAWQLQSGRFTARASPAFACMIYYHRLDADTLPKLRSQYVSPLRQRLETELRGIVAIAADARSDRQEKRRAELDDAIHELQKFDMLLEGVARTGFGPQSLHPALRQYAIDDAMLALKARWLRRLSELIAKSPLPDWLTAADRTELHPDFRTWIADAMSHLDYFCARVGPKPSDERKLVADPTTVDLAKLITPHDKEMLKDTLELACEKWWKQFDEVVLAPDKEQIKKLKEEHTICKEQLEADPAPSAVELQELKYRVKEIKDNVKTLTAQIKRRTVCANTIRTRIESWQSKEPLGWGDWLAEQPLFDRNSSLDGRRAAPTTIAEFITQESLYAPDINDGVRVNIAPLQKAGVLAADVLAGKDLDKAIADRAEWRADERRWVREGKLPQPGWWPEVAQHSPTSNSRGAAPTGRQGEEVKPA